DLAFGVRRSAFGVRISAIGYRALSAMAAAVMAARVPDVPTVTSVGDVACVAIAVAVSMSVAIAVSIPMAVAETTVAGPVSGPSVVATADPVHARSGVVGAARGCRSGNNGSRQD